MRPAIIVCETCRYSKEQPELDGRRGGEIFFDALRRAAATLPERDRFVLRTMRCLMACERHCTVHLRAPGKIGYVIGDMPPTEAGATVVLDYFVKYLRSETGVVAYASWPEGIKGHFIARIPPLDDEDR